MREHVLAMKAIWTKEEASYHGEFVNFDPVWSWPKPAQRPHPPILLGGETDHTLQRVVDYCDGWFPRPRSGFEASTAVDRLKHMAERRRAAIPRRSRSPCSARRRKPRRWPSYEKAGIQGALLAIPDDSRDEILRHLDKIAPLAKAARMSVAVGLGLMEFPFAGAGDYWRWVDLCEAGGVDSLWQTDRLVSRQPILECMAAMAALAGRTRRLRFGMNVVSLALRDPVLLAKQCATIDVLSEGRLLPAFGIGSPLGPEWKALDIDTKTRGRRTDESLEIIARLWREESVDFAGKHYRLNGASISPKPVQPDLPMWIGGSSDAAIRRTARYGTGWQGGGETPDDAGPGRRRDQEGRCPRPAARSTRIITARASRSISARRRRRRVGRWRPTPSAPAAIPARISRSATQTAILERVAEYVAGGVEKFILRPVGDGGERCIAQTQTADREGAAAGRARGRRWPKAA